MRCVPEATKQYLNGSSGTTSMSPLVNIADRTLDAIVCCLMKCRLADSDSVRIGDSEIGAITERQQTHTFLVHAPRRTLYHIGESQARPE